MTKINLTTYVLLEQLLISARIANGHKFREGAPVK